MRRKCIANGSRISNLGRVQRYRLDVKGWVRKAKAQMEWDLAMDVKNNKKEFYKYIPQERKAKSKGHNK